MVSGWKVFLAPRPLSFNSETIPSVIRADKSVKMMPKTFA